MEEREQQE